MSCQIRSCLILPAAEETLRNTLPISEAIRINSKSVEYRKNGRLQRRPAVHEKRGSAMKDSNEMKQSITGMVCTGMHLIALIKIS